MSGNKLRDALELLRKEGWKQGGYGRNYEGPNCGLGALARCMHLSSTGLGTGLGCYDEVKLLSRMAEELFPERIEISAGNQWGAKYVDFNDAPVTTFADVEQVFEKAAIRWDERI